MSHAGAVTTASLATSLLDLHTDSRMRRPLAEAAAQVEAIMAADPMRPLN